MTTVLFIRHGEVDNPQKIIYGRMALNLTEKGKKQLFDLATRLKQQNIFPEIIYSSPQQRTKESTTEILRVFQNTDVKYDDNLQEVDTQKLTGMPIAFQDRVVDIYVSPECKDLDIEKPEHTYERMNAVLKHILATYTGKTVFIVSHGDPLAFLRWRLLYPNQAFPPYYILRSQHYLEKGEAWKLEFDETGKCLSCIKV